MALALAALAVAGCGPDSGDRPDDRGPSSSASAPSAPAVILLPGNASPGDMTLTDDGTLWVVESALAAIAEIAPSGKITHHPLPRGAGFPPFPDDLQKSPDGGIWYTAGDQIGRLDPSGKFTWWDDDADAPGNGPGADTNSPGHPDALALGPGGTVWFEHSERGMTVFSRADTKQGLHRITQLKAQFSVGAGGMALGPDGAVWFSQKDEYGAEQREGIGRLTAEGDYKKWPLPEDSAPNDIVAGPDEALWFTDRRSIGRIDTDGDLSHFPVPASKYPSSVTLGPDKALWFTTDHRVGRITTKGQMTLWPVRGAKELVSVVPVPDGSFWLADSETDTVRRFTPPR
ncbi:hydrolase [Streptomyces sp. NBC_00439]|uniref:Vgb family protein n=1 Tax=unclassified Streptomyces TaxID=2593676 RepID=UPI00225BC261|nr:hydrolase [Streptomyces sp. NBC_00439]WSX06178.1 hydrolase [Streptomyces sp. NBC_00987]